MLLIRRLRKRIVDIVLTLHQLICEEVMVVGDSHTAAFSMFRMRVAFRRYFMNVVTVNGATASGLENPNSKTQAQSIFLAYMARSRAKWIIFLLGEVDVGFVIWHRAQKYQSPINDMVELAVRNYQNLLNAAATNHKVVCVSTPLPTIKDDQHWGEVAHLRKQIHVSQKDRTALTRLFNTRMKNFCNASGINYLDLDDESSGPDGLVRRDLMNKDPTDHHYDRSAYARMITPRLRSLLRGDASLATEAAPPQA